MAERLSLVQAFLSKKSYSIFMVSLDREAADLRLVCDCPGFAARAACKHVKYIFDKMVENNGEYRLEVPHGMRERAKDMTPEELRQVVLRYGNPVVL